MQKSDFDETERSIFTEDYRNWRFTLGNMKFMIFDNFMLKSQNN